MSDHLTATAVAAKMTALERAIVAEAAITDDRYWTADDFLDGGGQRHLTFEDCAGNPRWVEELRQSILTPMLTNPKDGSNDSTKSNSATVLLYGPTGCGKSWALRCMRGDIKKAEAEGRLRRKVVMLGVNYTDVMSKSRLETLERVDSLFSAAEKLTQEDFAVLLDLTMCSTILQDVRGQEEAPGQAKIFERFALLAATRRPHVYTVVECFSLEPWDLCADFLGVCRKVYFCLPDKKLASAILTYDLRRRGFPVGERQHDEDDETGSVCCLPAPFFRGRKPSVIEPPPPDRRYTALSPDEDDIYHGYTFWRTGRTPGEIAVEKFAKRKASNGTVTTFVKCWVEEQGSESEKRWYRKTFEQRCDPEDLRISEERVLHVLSG